MRYEEFLKEVIKEYVEESTIDLDSFPDMEIYMDQAETFVNKELSIYRKDEKDKIITKTMISNYVKHNMLPRPVNKKYSKNHLIILTLIYYLKGTFQMDETGMFLKPLLDNYNSEFDEKIDIEALYEGIIGSHKKECLKLESNVMETVENIKKHLNETEETDDDMLELFMLVMNLSMKADAQKYLAHKILNEYVLKPKQKKW